jgi:hypothetical protein
MKGTLYEDQFTFFIISRSFLLRMRNVSDKVCREGQNTHFVFLTSSAFPAEFLEHGHFLTVFINSAYTIMLTAFVAICQGWDISARVREREMSSYVFAV